MNVKILNELSLLKTALSVEYSNYLALAAESSIPPNFIQLTLNVYAAYCYLVKQGNYSALEILNDASSVNAHFQSCIGFVYNYDDTTIRRRYEIGNHLKNLFCYIAQDKHLTLDEVKLSSLKITEEASSCLAQFRELNIDKSKS